MLDQNYLDTAHLLRRAGFGSAPADITAAANAGLKATTHALLHPEEGAQDPDDTDMIDKLASAVPDRKNKRVPVQFVKIWWTHRMLSTQHPLVEKMVLFWHGHFTSKLGDGEEMLAQNQLFRSLALGNFRTLAQAISKDPAMLRYLNGNQNFKAHPNENYARELMELFTCGIGHYTEDDVKAGARAFSGWNLRGDQFYFNPREHDDGVKTFLGHTGNWNGNDIVDFLVDLPSTATRICKQLFEYFAYPNPEADVLEALTQTYYSSGYDIRAVVGQILTSNAFYSAKARNAIIKSPVQYVVGSIKMLGLDEAFDAKPDDVDEAADAMAPSSGGSAPVGGGRLFDRIRAMRVGRLTALTVAMRSMGQDILSPPSVKGWDGEEAWINSSTLLNRINFANRISQSRALYRYLEPSVDALAASSGDTSVTAWVDYLLQTLGPLQVSDATRKTLIDFASGVGPYSGDRMFAQNDGDDAVAFAEQQASGDMQTTAGGDGQGAGPGGGRRLFGQPTLLPGAQGRMLALIPLIMATPEYQVC